MMNRMKRRDLASLMRAASAAVLLLALVLACGPAGRPVTTLPSNSGGTAHDSLKAGLDRLAPPKGVSPELFAGLKAVLEQNICELPPPLDAPPARGVKVVQDLSVNAHGEAPELVWTYRNEGDYNSNGVVSLEDLCPLAGWFGTRVEEEPLAAEADGDGNGVVGISDITVLARNLYSSVARYVVQTAPAPEGPFVDFAEVLRSEGVRAGAFPVYTLPVLPGESAWYRVVAVDGFGNVAEPSEPVAIN